MKHRYLPAAAIALAVALVAVAAVAAFEPFGGGSGGEGAAPGARFVERGGGDPSFDVEGFQPLAYERSRDGEFLRRGRDGLAHVLYVKSPGGAVRSARRVDGFRDEIERAAGLHGVEADTLAALVFLESGGRVDVIAGPDPGYAAGLAQILPGTAEGLLGMRVELEESKRLTSAIARHATRAERAGTARKRRRARRRLVRAQVERRRVDERFDPEQALAGAARYLEIAQERFGREDLAATSYHMGIGNLDDVIRTYIEPRPANRSTRRNVEDNDITFPRLYFDSSPGRNPRAYRKLLGLGDDSRHYLFKLEASREILRLHREDREELARLIRLHAAKGSAEEVLRPPDEHEPYGGPDELEDAYRRGELLRLPDDPARLGFTIDRNMGALAGRLDQPRAVYRGLRPEVLATLLYIAKEVRRLSGGGRIRVTSTVRDRPYQRLLVERNTQATSAFSVHTIGYSIDVTAAFKSKRRRAALEFVLGRLQALGVLDFIHEPGAIHFTVGPEGKAFLPMLQAVREWPAKPK